MENENTKQSPESGDTAKGEETACTDCESTVVTVIEPEPEQEPAGLNPAMLLVVLAVLGGIGALVYFNFIKQKPKTKGSDNLDDYDYGEDDTEQEDEDPWETEESDEPEDAGGGGDEESENPAK